VMAWDPLRAVKAEPRYEGPLTVIRRQASVIGMQIKLNKDKLIVVNIILYTL